MYPYPVTQHSDTGSGTTVPGRTPARIMRSRDMRADGLGNASDHLSMQIADMDVVHVARAKADITMCPVCPVAHPV